MSAVELAAGAPLLVLHRILPCQNLKKGGICCLEKCGVVREFADSVVLAIIWSRAVVKYKQPAAVSVLFISVMINIYSVGGRGGKSLRKYSKFEVFRALKIHITSFWVMTPCYCLVNE
jgi:hypothetical protein